MKLYEISSAYRQVLEHEPAMGTDEETSWLEILDAIEENLETKVQSIGLFIRELSAEAEAIEAEEKRLADRRRSVTSKAGRLKEYLAKEMEFAGLDKIKTPVLTVSFQNNPPAVEITGDVPEAYQVAQEPKVDKRAIMDALKQGQELAFARITQGKSLRIK